MLFFLWDLNEASTCFFFVFIIRVVYIKYIFKSTYTRLCIIMSFFHLVALYIAKIEFLQKFSECALSFFVLFGLLCFYCTANNKVYYNVHIYLNKFSVFSSPASLSLKQRRHFWLGKEKASVELSFFIHLSCSFIFVLRCRCFLLLHFSSWF